MTGWLAPRPPTGLVLDGIQMVSVKVAVALCADAAAAPGDLGPMTEHRVPLGRGMDALCERLRRRHRHVKWAQIGKAPVERAYHARLAAGCPGRRAGRRPSRANRAAGGGAAGGRVQTDRSGRVVVRLSEPERGLPARGV